MQGIEDVLYPMGQVNLWEGNAIKGTEESLRSKPHLVTDEMREGAKGKGKHPGFPMASVEV